MRCIPENEIYNLFSQNGTAKLHVADIDCLPRIDVNNEHSEGAYLYICYSLEDDPGTLHSAVIRVDSSGMELLDDLFNKALTKISEKYGKTRFASYTYLGNNVEFIN